MKFFSYLITLMIFLMYDQIKCLNLDKQGLYSLLNELSANTIVNQNRKVVFFLINQKKKKLDYNRYMNYLIEFLKTSGVKCDMYNVENRHYVAVTDLDNFINRDEILLRFKNIILDIAEGLAVNFLKELNEKRTEL